MVAKTQVALVAAAAFLVAACGPRPPAGEPTPPPTNEVAEVVFPSVDGGEVDLARFRGKPVVVHFASTSSLDSQADVEELRRTRTRVPELVLVEVVVDEGGARMASPWANASRIDWLVLLPTPGVMGGGSAFGRIRVVPSTFLLDRAGRVGWRWEGALPRGLLDKPIAGLL